MTDREAIDVLFNEWKCIDRNDGIHCDRKCESCDLVMDVGIIREAFNMAISALQEQEEKTQLSVEGTTSDLISRQAAIALADSLKDDLPDDERIADTVMAHNEGILEYQTKLSLLPSEQPEIIRCRDCKYFRTYYHGTESDPVITHACVWFLDREMGPEDYCSKGVFR